MNDTPIVFPNARGRRKNRRRFGRKVYVTNPRKSFWKSIPWPIRLFVWVSVLPTLIALGIFAFMLLIGIMDVS